MKERRRRGGPVGIAEAVEGAMGRIDPQRGRLGKVVAAWRDLVGEEVFRHARPSAIARGTLYVTVSDPIWQSELRFFDRELLEKINASAGGKELLTHVRYRLGLLEGTGEAAEREETAAPPAAGAAPPEVPPELRESVRGIDDPFLRAIVERLAAQIGEREPPARGGGRGGGRR